MIVPGQATNKSRIKCDERRITANFDHENESSDNRFRNFAQDVSKNLIRRWIVVGILDSFPFLPTFPATAVNKQFSQLPFPADDAIQTANAGRLLMSNDITRIRTIAPDVMKQAFLQDQRLSQCREVGENWEQCFYYGTQASPQGEATKSYPQWLTPHLRKASPPATAKSRIPTW
jgi:hypothetical protein